MAIESVTVQTVQTAMLSEAPARAAPSELAVEQFNAVMNAPSPAVSSSSGAQAAGGATAAPVDDGPASLGNRILSGLERSSTELSSRWNSISTRLDQTASAPRLSDMLRVQAELLQVSVQSEMVGKAVSKSTQNLDSMVRMQ